MQRDIIRYVQLLCWTGAFLLTGRMLLMIFELVLFSGFYMGPMSSRAPSLETRLWRWAPFVAAVVLSIAGEVLNSQAKRRPLLAHFIMCINLLITVAAVLVVSATRPGWFW